MKLLSLLLSGAALVTVPATVMAASSYAVRANGDQISVQTTGNVTFALDSDAIYDLHDTGTLRVTEKNGTQTHFFFASGSQITYQVNGVDAPFDDSGKTWLRMVLSEEPPPPPPPPPP